MFIFFGGVIVSRFHKYCHWLVALNFSKNYTRNRTEIFAISFFMVVFLIQSSILMKSRPYHISNNGHALVSLNLAINKVICKKESILDAGTSKIVQELLMEPRWSDISILSAPEKILGISSEQYCESVNTDFMNNENTLMRLYVAVMSIFPKISLKEIGQAFDFVRIIGITFTMGILSYIGFSLFLSIFLGFFALLMNYYECDHIYGLYPFIPIFVFLYSALIALILHQKWYKHYKNSILSSVLLGSFGALFFNLRTSYLPFIIIGFIVFLATMYADVIQQKIKNNRALLMLTVSFMTFIASFYYVHSQITVVKPTNNYNYAYHAIAHPLVLALGIPENSLSRREGIVWNDSVGPTLAQKIDPQTTYLDKSYEKALFIYYIDLWKRYPKEMLNIYFQKWKMALYDTYQMIFNITMNTVGNSEITLVNYVVNKIYKPIYSYTPEAKYRHLNEMLLVGLIGIVFLYFLFTRDLLYTLRLLSMLFLMQYPLLGDLQLGGMMYTALLIVVMVVAMTKMRKWNASVIAFIVTINMAAFLIMLEATIIMPFFGLMYHSTFVIIITANLLYVLDNFCKQIFSIAKTAYFNGIKFRFFQNP